MLYEEAIARQANMLAHPETIRIKAEWEQARKLDRLQRSVSVVRARLGLASAGVS